MSSATETFTLDLEQAERYEQAFVPALFARWTGPLLDAAGLGPGLDVLDVGCGTGVLARAAAARVGAGGSVTGLDLNPAMLAVARRLRPDLRWQVGDAQELPFAEGSFDAVLCQSALMFVPDATRALREMARVSRPGGVVGVQVYSGLDRQPAYGPWVRLVADLAGPESARLLDTYWVHGDARALVERFAVAGLPGARASTLLGTVSWPSVETMVDVEIGATPLAGRIDAALRSRLVADSHAVLDRWTTDRGAEVPIEALFVVARKE